jgi:diguanylate cyclase (GGDEF)-like protein
VGQDSSEAPRDQSFCARTITHSDGIYVVPDARLDPVWAAHPDVTGEAGVRFYAGASVVDEQGLALGTVCVVDTQPRELDDQQLDALRRLARQTASHLRARVETKRIAGMAEQLRHAALHDDLTGLSTRGFFEEVLAIALRQRQRDGLVPGILFCDLDAFKPINDQLGHDAGDQLLVAVARRLQRSARQDDLVARFGGDEFVVLCPRLTCASDLDAIARRVATGVSSPLQLGDTQVTPQLSVGAAFAGPDETAADLLRRADQAMYTDKGQRRR